MLTAACCVQLTTTILDIVQQAANYKQLRKGANEGDGAAESAWQLNNILAFVGQFCLVVSISDDGLFFCSHEDVESRNFRICSACSRRR